LKKIKDLQSKNSKAKLDEKTFNSSKKEENG
jgi:hypothetical protein